MNPSINRLWIVGSRPKFWLSFIGIVSAFFTVAGLSGCMGGTGTTTDNGITRTDTSEDPAVGLTMRFEQRDGRPAPGLRVHVFAANYNPVISQAESILVGKSDSLVTSPEGKLHLRFVQPGTYVVEASDSMGVVVLDTVWILNPEKKDSVRLKTEPNKRFAGRITLESGLRIQSGWVIVRGTRAKARVDSAGHYDLGAWPLGLRGRAAVWLDQYRTSPTKVITGVLVSDTNKSNSILDTLPEAKAPDSTPRQVSILLPEYTVSLPETVVTVRCAGGTTTATGAACVQPDTAVYVTNKDAMASAAPAWVANDTLKHDQYLANGTALPACTASSALKSSDDLLASESGEESNFTVLDVTQAPTCFVP